MGIVPGMCLFLSTPSARRATVPCGQVSSCLFISIHALREESDFCLPRRLCRRCYFYPRPPRGERQKSRFFLKKVRNFYPRPPRGERPASVGHASAVSRFLSTPSARRATLRRTENVHVFDISIHALREESDASGDRPQKLSMIFLSTPSARRATDPKDAGATVPFISIHALREESDTSSTAFVVSIILFLSTPSARRATRLRLVLPLRFRDFYPRPPRGERPGCRPLCTTRFHFYPRPPRGERQRKPQITCSTRHISIHALREESDYNSLVTKYGFAIFLSTPSARRATGARGSP